MAVNQFRQRLVAAGATPERASQFINQRAFQALTPMREPSVLGEKPAAAPGIIGPKPKGPQEWYNDNYASGSEGLYPAGFRAPKFGDENFDSYYDYVFGKGSYSKLTTETRDKNLSMKAPLFVQARKNASNSSLDFNIVKGLELGNTAPQIINQLLGSPQRAQILGNLPERDAINYINRIAGQYYSAIGSEADIEKIVNARIAKDRDFRYRMPDPRLRYGLSTDLNRGVVDILSNPTAAKAYAAYAATEKDPTKLTQYKAKLVGEAANRGVTPWKDEARRRDALKGKKLK